MKENVNMSGIRMREIASLLFHKSWIIIICGIMFSMMSYIAGNKLLSPNYKSSTKIYILNRADESNLTTSDLSVSSSLTQDYGELVCSRNVIESVIAKLGLNMTEKAFSSMISVDSESNDSRILKITVTTGDPYSCYEIVNMLRDVAAQHIKSVMDIDSVQVVERASIPEHESSPDLMRVSLLGFLMGLLIASAVIIVMRISNNNITTSEDVKRYLGLSVLGMIPNNSKKNSSKKNKSKYK